MRIYEILTVPYTVFEGYKQCPIPTSFIGECREGSIVVVGAVPTKPVPVGSYVEGDNFVLGIENHFNGNVTVTLSGIRKHI